MVPLFVKEKMMNRQL